MGELQQIISLAAEVGAEHAGKRLDQTLAVLFPAYSRSRLKAWIEAEQVQVNGKGKRPRDPVFLGDKIVVEAALAVISPCEGEAIPLNIIYEDEWLLVVNKPCNWVVHPGTGNRVGTVLNALLHYYPALNQIPRAGIVHRLDKDTSGLMVIAKDLTAQAGLVAALQARKVKRIYEAIVCGAMPAGGTLEAPIGRHPTDRIRMAVVEGGKTAITHYRVIKRFKAHTHLRVEIETGRTHQIRVHLAHIRYPVVGDKMYGGRFRLPPNATLALQDALRQFPRQALHAKELSLLHPITGQAMHWVAPTPDDMLELLSQLGDSAVVLTKP